MVLNIVVLLMLKFVDFCEDGFIYVDFGGGFLILGSCYVILFKVWEEFWFVVDVVWVVKIEDECE